MPDPQRNGKELREDTVRPAARNSKDPHNTKHENGTRVSTRFAFRANRRGWYTRANFGGLPDAPRSDARRAVRRFSGARGGLPVCRFEERQAEVHALRGG